MTQIRFFTDEDIYAAVAPALRRAGFDALSTPEAGRCGQSDESQLSWAAQNGRNIVTFNVAHFTALHAASQTQGLHHAGVIVSQQRAIGDLIRRLLHLGQTLDAQSMMDNLPFLSDW